MIITGCQKSGTKSIAVMFGLNHEKIFTSHTTLTNIAVHSDISECSWLAAPFIKYFKNKDIPVIRLVRHPQAVVNSLLNNGFKGREFILKYLPQIANFKSPLKKSVFYWTHWNRLLGTIPTIKIETITDALVLNITRSSEPLPHAAEDIQSLEGTSLYKDLVETMNDYQYNF